MLGERTYSAQETAHLLLGIPLVRTSVTFQSLNLARDGSLRALGTTAGDAAEEIDEPIEGEGNRVVTDRSWLQRSGVVQ